MNLSDALVAVSDDLRLPDRNTVRLTVYRPSRRRPRLPAALRRVFDDQAPALPTLTGLARADELRLANGLPARYLPRLAEALDGQLIGCAYNLRTNAGINYAADSVANSASRPAVADRIAISQDATAPAAGDTALAAEITTGGLARAQASYLHVSNALTYTLTLTWTVAAGASFTALQKLGLLNAASGGTLVLESTVSAAAANATDQVVPTWTVSL